MRGFDQFPGFTFVDTGRLESSLPAVPSLQGALVVGNVRGGPNDLTPVGVYTALWACIVVRPLARLEYPPHSLQAIPHKAG
jgi:hypothetical protein